MRMSLVQETRGASEGLSFGASHTPCCVLAICQEAMKWRQGSQIWMERKRMYTDKLGAGDSRRFYFSDLYFCLLVLCVDLVALLIVI